MNPQYSFDGTNLDLLIQRLRGQGYQVVGPKLNSGAITYDFIESLADLPRGWTEIQEKGFYNLKRRNDQAYFGYTVGPTSWKRFLFPPREKLWAAERTGKSYKIIPQGEPEPRLAFLGVRACDTAAIKIQDKVFMEGSFRDERYARRRESALIIGVQCVVSGPTCFCTSMNTGPQISESANVDIVLTELISESTSEFIISGRTTLGNTLLEGLGKPALEAQTKRAAEDVDHCRTAVATQGRKLDPAAAKENLATQPDHPRWDLVAERCINCANCTLSCPTCFCSTVEDVQDLTGDHAERWRTWDSCFTLDFSHLHGGPVRTSAKSRYRQWMTHKLSTWWEQFNSSGCVGCGRCITWCPVGIDITEEARAIGGPP